MKLMPSTTLKDLDETDIDSLFPWYLWKIHSGQSEQSDGIVYRDGKPYLKVKPQESRGLRNL